MQSGTYLNIVFEKHLPKRTTWKKHTAHTHTLARTAANRRRNKLNNKGMEISEHDLGKQTDRPNERMRTRVIACHRMRAFYLYLEFGEHSKPLSCTNRFVGMFLSSMTLLRMATMENFGLWEMWVCNSRRSTVVIGISNDTVITLSIGGCIPDVHIHTQHRLVSEYSEGGRHCVSVHSACLFWCVVRMFGNAHLAEKPAIETNAIGDVHRFTYTIGHNICALAKYLVDQMCTVNSKIQPITRQHIYAHTSHQIQRKPPAK